ncbi:aminoglycoside phosphotransferase family protein [Streptomyces graminifolii]|uniref:aminoglycoside phosphotransferase family protein n=1 Tax=Streptomyces TaxID=1883 RepID=UPI003696FEBA
MTTSPRADAAPVPTATNDRLPWEKVPERVRSAVEDRLGSRVVTAHTQSGGFSPGVAARVQLADGRRAFIKAVSADLNPDSPRFHRSEALVARRIPPQAPVPQLLADEDLDGWVVLVFEDIDGVMPSEPWHLPDLRRVLDATLDLAATLDPAPIESPTIEGRYGDMFAGFRAMADDPWPDPWTRRHARRLAEMEAEWARASAGSALVHADLRADNILLTEDRVVFVDWAHGAVGASWFDVVFLAGSVIMHNGREGIDVLDEHLAERAVDPEAVNCVLTAATGFFLYQSLQPIPPNLAGLRDFQRVQGEATLGWLRERTGWS